ncbi:MAG: hypothetical protein ACRC2R_19260 [Xenococcaceae cyanobacterium]
MPIAFIVCTEAGMLEQESLLLVESIRKFCGSLKDTPIYSFQVRKDREISENTLKIFKSFDVIHEAKILNHNYPEYPMANKPLLCAEMEKNIDADILVFLDSDIVFFSDPKEFLLSSEYDIGVRPEHKKNIGSSGIGDPNEEFWQEVYKLIGVKQERFITATVDRQRMRTYWNAGVVAVRRKAGIFSAWKENFEKLINSEIRPSEGFKTYYLDQVSLAATTDLLTENICCFSPSYNYPLNFHNELPKSDRFKSFDEIVCIHDHFFRTRSKDRFKGEIWIKLLKSLKNFDKSSPKYQWLYEYLLKNGPRSEGFIPKILESSYGILSI